jgi:hypothetical protein
MKVRRGVGSLVLVLGCSLTACSGDGGAEPTPSPLPSGSLGVVTPEAAVSAVQGLCGVREAPDASAAKATFYDRTHDELHVIAAATEEQDRSAAASLLEAMQRVEAELEHPPLPGGFSADVDALVGTTRAALEAIGLDAPACT